ncbi:hypothetical protein MX551_004727 [Salmonella enterica]|nr:hypothetical protein [Salmonella enterica]EJC1135987.1 hypothetical protein [Salmonella enterica]EJC1459602.1 hypothetical protein [Salmonella enterica]
MKIFLLFSAIIAGLLSFDSYAASCPTGAIIPAGTYKPYYGTALEKYINIGGCEYQAKSGWLTTHEGSLVSDGFVSTGNPAEPGVSQSVDENGNSPQPDVTPPQPDVTPPEPDKPAPPSSSYLSQVLSDISHATPAMLYSSFYFHYDFSSSLEDNKRVAQAFLQKLSNVTPPDYASVDRIKSMMDDWQKVYSYLRPPNSGIYYLWNATKFVGGEHRYRGAIYIAVYNCAEPDYRGNCPDEYKPLDIPDPNYASLNDYKNGITRCMRNPNDPSCHSSDDSSGDSGDSSGDHTVTTCSPGYHPDASRPGVCVSDNPGAGDSSGDHTVTNCNPGYHPEPSRPDICVADINPNPGDGGGSGSGNTDNNDNGDVVAAIDRFHADNNATQKQLLDQLKQNDDYSDATNKMGDLFTNGISDFKSGAESSINSLIDSLEKYAPGLKGFGLPDGFYSSSGRCVPLDMGFTVSLPFYNYSSPVNLSTEKLCKYYDGYPRELLRMLIYMLTVFVLIVLLKHSLK